MSTYFAQIDHDGKVLDIRIVTKQFMELNPDMYPGAWVETFFTHEDNPRKRPAQMGGIYDKNKDIFINQKPFPSWVLNEQTQDWDAPIPKPTLKYKTKINITENEWYYQDLAEDGIYDPAWVWNENTLQWVPYGGRN